MLWAFRMGCGGAILAIALGHIITGQESWWCALAGFIPAFAWARSQCTVKGGEK